MEGPGARAAGLDGDVDQRNRRLTLLVIPGRCKRRIRKSIITGLDCGFRLPAFGLGRNDGNGSYFYARMIFFLLPVLIFLLAFFVLPFEVMFYESLFLSLLLAPESPGATLAELRQAVWRSFLPQNRAADAGAGSSSDPACPRRRISRRLSARAGAFTAVAHLPDYFTARGERGHPLLWLDGAARPSRYRQYSAVGDRHHRTAARADVQLVWRHGRAHARPPPVHDPRAGEPRSREFPKALRTPLPCWAPAPGRVFATCCSH